MHAGTQTDRVRHAIVAATLLLCLAIFFRDALRTRLSLLYGDSYDGMIEVAILNHWYNVFVHGDAWTLTGWFAPYGDTLGYNDSYIVPGVFFTLARIAGADPFLAAFASHVVMKAIGFLGLYALLRRGLALGTALALAGAAIFATANASLLHMHHAQLLAVGLVPWLMLFALQAVRAALEDRTPALWRNGIAFALLFGVSALSAFYQAWFLSVFLLVFMPVGLAVAGPAQRAALWAAARRHGRVLAGIAAIGAIALLPLLLVYLPKLAAGGGHPFAPEVRAYLPVPGTWVNVGRGNLMWGNILPIEQFRRGEHRFGFAPGMLLLTMVATGWASRHRREARLMLALGISLLVVALLITRWPPAFAPWKPFYYVIPGASGVRVMSRFLLFLLIPAIALVLLLLQRWQRRPLAIGLVIAFLLAEQIQVAAPLMLDRAVQRRMLADAGAPPADCDSFFVVSARPRSEDVEAEGQRVIAAWGGGDGHALAQRYRHNVDAMMLASWYRRPTINGFSTFNPPDWDFERPDAPDYLARIRTYAHAHAIGRLCGLDMRRPQHWFALR